VVVIGDGGGDGSDALAVVTWLSALSYTAMPTLPRVVCTYILQDYLVQWLYCCICSISQQPEEAGFKPGFRIYFITIIVRTSSQVLTESWFSPDESRFIPDESWFIPTGIPTN
jgi:hypothetical protein